MLCGTDRCVKRRVLLYRAVPARWVVVVAAGEGPLVRLPARTVVPSAICLIDATWSTLAGNEATRPTTTDVGFLDANVTQVGPDFYSSL